MILYNITEINNITQHTIKNARSFVIKGKKFVYIRSGYDVETTRINNKAYVYHHAISFNNSVFGFRKWQDFINWIYFANSCMNKKYRNSKIKTLLILWVANLSHEFQFLKDRFELDVFATKPRQPLTATYDHIQFKEALTISGGGLAYLAKNYCTTQKMIGDLDYTISRNTTTPLNKKELQYIENDVIILAEYAQYVFTNVKKWGCMPYTATGILREECKRQARKNDIYLHEIQKAYFTEDEYKIYMRWLFRGGFTHANREYVNRILFDVESWDKKSSYPSKMLQEYFPADKFMPTTYNEKLLDDYCCILDIEFNNIRSTTKHSLESSHKCISYYNAYWDNGRLIQADKLRVLLTELDFKTYQLFYKWDNMTVLSCKIAHKRKFPFFLQQLILKYFDIKEHTPKDTAEYIESKKRINAFYGMCVTMLHLIEHIYKNGVWTQEHAQYKGREKTFTDCVNNDFLLPAWGIWITAHARYDLLVKGVYPNQKHVVYCDTDSIYFNKGYSKQLLIDYNKTLEDINTKSIQANYINLGCYEFEGRYRRFKTMGAKRYVKEYYLKDLKQHTYKIISITKNVRSKQHKSYYIALNRHTQTIAGLGKTALIEYCNKTHQDIFKVFGINTKLESTYTQKLTTHYNDTPHSDIVNGELMQELSSVALMPSDFKMTITKEYLNLILKNRSDRA